MEYVVYKTTHRASGKYYIGKASMWQYQNGYTGGGNLIVKAVAKHGRKAFTREILYTTDSETDAYDKEAELVNHKDPMSYNIIRGGRGGKGRKMPQDVKDKMKTSQRARREREAQNKMPEPEPRDQTPSEKSWIKTPRDKPLTAEQQSGYYPQHCGRNTQRW